MHLTAVLLLFSLIAHAHGSRTNKSRMTEEEANRVISESMKQRAALFVARHGPIRPTNHTETDQEFCSEYCRARRGNGICDHSCYTPACIHDMGDCPNRPFLTCSELSCPVDQCDSDCHIQRCNGNCEDGKHQQYLLFFTPFLTASTIHNSFPKIEQRIRDKTDLALKLQMIWGVHKGKIDIFAHLWGLYPNRKDYPEAFALFSVESGLFHPQDHKTLHFLKTMGGHSHVASVVPMLLGPEQKDHFAPYVASYDQQRKKLTKHE